MGSDMDRAILAAADLPVGKDMGLSAARRTRPVASAIASAIQAVQRHRC
jgi:hypothetical protein